MREHLLGELLLWHPAMPALWLRLGDVTTDLQQYRVSQRLLEIALTKTSQEEEFIRSRLGRAFALQGLHTEAVEHYQRAIEVEAEKRQGINPWSHIYMADSLLQLEGREAEALRFLDGLRQSSMVESALYWNLRGHALDGLGRPSEAQEAYARARSLTANRRP